MSVILSLFIAIIFMYFVFKIGTVEKGMMKNAVMFILLALATIISSIFDMLYIGIIIATILTLLFDMFYDEEGIYKQWKWIITFATTNISIYLLHRGLYENYDVLMIIPIILAMYIILSLYRGLVQAKANILVLAIYSIYIYTAYTQGESRISNLMIILAILTYLVFEFIIDGYSTTFKRKTAEFQQELLLNQYEEIKNIYLNMRGFRHDYHNHIQVIKAHLHNERRDLVEAYLLKLESQLERIDSSVKCGNLMIDAILNSKISLAEKYNIEVSCKAKALEKLPISDIDLCVILGNLLDNAIESCQKVNDNKFIRIYVAVIKKQLYISIQNAAKEELDFNEKNYISTKRGNHGLGMKRVQALVDKYDGFLNLQNEPGVFAAEVTFSI